MASFGYGSSDILALTKLAWDVVQNSRKACGEYDELTQEITSFHTILKRAEYETRKPECLLTPDRELELQNILLPCRTVLDTLNQIMQKYNTLSSDEKGKGTLASLCQSVCFGNGEMQDLGVLRGKITARMLALSVFLNTLALGSLGRIEQKMNGDLKYIKLAVNEEIARLIAIPENNREGSILTCYGDDDKAFWKEFRRSLIKKGFNSKILEKNKETIVGYITEIGKNDILDDDNIGIFPSATPNSEVQSTSSTTGNEIGGSADTLSTGNSIEQDWTRMSFKLIETIERNSRRRRLDGHRQCGSDVIGLWAQGTHRRFRASELRFEVLFQTPVIIVTPPTNKNGPIPFRPVYYIDGSPDSCEATYTTSQKEVARRTLINTKSPTTADNELASWVVLLNMLQIMESYSRNWDSNNGFSPRTINHRVPEYTISVGLQRKTRSWDFMPATVFKPFATTTICHLVEIVAMLGMHWKMLDQKTWQLRAEGNGLILTSTIVHNLGVMVFFAKTGTSFYSKNRIIPSKHLKAIAFGLVPSVFCNESSLNLLDFGYGLNRTLELLGCTTDTIAKYQKKHNHLYPITFDIVGMLALPIRLRGSNFRMLPNPTTSYSFPSNFSRRKLMTTFQSELNQYLIHVQKTSSSTLSTDSYLAPIKEIAEQWIGIQQLWSKIDDLELDINIDLRELIHDALNESDVFLLNQPLDCLYSVIACHITAVIDSLHSNNTSFNNLFNMGENSLIQMYFSEIREKVVTGEDKTISDPNDDHSSDDSGDENEEGDGSWKEVWEKTLKVRAQRNAIWFTLIFRMLCWLLLHEFDPLDSNLTTSDLMGSQMPVYIG